MKGAGAGVRGARAYRGLQDAQLLALVAERDGGALDGLYDRYGKHAYSLAYRILGDHALAQDVTQGVFLSLWREAGRYSAGHGTVATRLLAQAHRRALEIVRGNESLRRAQASQGHLAFHLGGADADAVQRALAGLDPTEREALALAYFGGYTQREIAALVGVPLATIKTRMAAGLRRLRDALVADGQEEPSPWTPR